MAWANQHGCRSLAVCRDSCHAGTAVLPQHATRASRATRRALAPTATHLSAAATSSKLGRSSGACAQQRCISCMARAAGGREAWWPHATHCSAAAICLIVRKLASYSPLLLAGPRTHLHILPLNVGRQAVPPRLRVPRRHRQPLACHDRLGYLLGGEGRHSWLGPAASQPLLLCASLALIISDEAAGLLCCTS